MTNKGEGDMEDTRKITGEMETGVSQSQQAAQQGAPQQDASQAQQDAS